MLLKVHMVVSRKERKLYVALPFLATAFILRHTVSSEEEGENGKQEAENVAFDVQLSVWWSAGDWKIQQSLWTSPAFLLRLEKDSKMGSGHAWGTLIMPS